jgi:hypothetical protein
LETPVPALLRIAGLGAKSLVVKLTISGHASTQRTGSDTTAKLVFDNYGMFSGTFVDPASREEIPFQGFVPGASGFGAGYFYVPGKSGAVTLEKERLPEEP